MLQRTPPRQSVRDPAPVGLPFETPVEIPPATPITPPLMNPMARNTPTLLNPDPLSSDAMPFSDPLQPRFPYASDHPASDDDDAGFRRRNRNRQDDMRFVNSSVSSALLRIKPDMLLKADGSNFQTWFRDLQLLLDEFCDTPDFLTRHNPSSSSPRERIGRSILLNSLDKTLRDQFIEIRPSTCVFSLLCSSFHAITRTSQLTAWQQLVSIDGSKFASTAELVSKVNSTTRNLLDNGVVFDQDTIVGLILQASIVGSYQLSDALAENLDATMCRQNRPPTTAEIGVAMEMCRRQQLLRTRGPQSREHELSASANSSRVAEPAGSVDDVGDPDAQAARLPLLCHICSSPAHLAATCPANTRGPAPTFSTQSRARSGQGPFQAFYPIIAPPLPNNQQFQPRWDNSRRPAPADSYRPNYGRGAIQRGAAPPRRPFQTTGQPRPAQARITELDDATAEFRTVQFENLNIDPSSLPLDSPILDSGATHHLTGDRPGGSDLPWADWSPYNT